MTPGRLEAAGQRQLAQFVHQVGSHDYKREPACLGFDIQDAPEGVPEGVPEDALEGALVDVLEDAHEGVLGDALEDVLEDALEDGLEDADFGHKQPDNKDLAAGLDCIGVVGPQTSDVGQVVVLASSAFVVVGFAEKIKIHNTFFWDKFIGNKE